MIIRKLRKYEINAALLLVWKTFLEFEAPDYKIEGIIEFKKTLEDNIWINEREFFGALENEIIIGVIATVDRNSIELFFVDKKYQKQGIGKKLFKEVKKYNTCGYFIVNSSPYAREIYEHMGFKCIDTMQEIDGIKFYPMKIYL